MSILGLSTEWGDRIFQSIIVRGKNANLQSGLSGNGCWRGPGRVKGAEFHRNNFSRNHVGGGGECCLV